MHVCRDATLLDQLDHELPVLAKLRGKVRLELLVHLVASHVRWILDPVPL